MAFIKRKNEKNLTDLVGNVNQTITDDVSNQSVKFTNNVEIKNYREDAIRTLNILEKKGINIYDTNRFGGMYLKSKENESIKIAKIFEEKDTQNTGKSKQLNLTELLNIFN